MPGELACDSELDVTGLVAALPNDILRVIHEEHVARHLDMQVAARKEDAEKFLTESELRLSALLQHRLNRPTHGTQCARRVWSARVDLWRREREGEHGMGGRQPRQVRVLAAHE